MSCIHDTDPREYEYRAMRCPPPYPAGEQFGDAIAAFSDPPPGRRPLHEISSEWQGTALAANESGYGPLRAKADAVRFARFWSRFSHCELRESFLKLPEVASQPDADSRAEAAARSFLRWLEAVPSPAGGKGDKLSALMRSGRLDRGLDFPWNQSAAGEGGGWNWGDGTGELTAREFRIAELLPRLRKDYIFAAQKRTLREWSPFPADDLDFLQINSFSQLPSALAADLCESDDDLFCLRVATKQIRRTEHYALKQQPARFVLLLDVSGSMTERCEDGFFREEYAVAASIALLESAAKGANEVTLIRFDGCAHPPVCGKPREVCAELWKSQFSGGGTNFENAFRAADQHSPEAVVLITDGESNYEKIPAAPLHVLAFGPGSERLQKESVKYECKA